MAQTIQDTEQDEIWPKKFRDDIDQAALILSLTKRADDLLMWSHYADQHRGFVIGFDADSPFFKSGNGRNSGGLQDVVYSKNRSQIPDDGLDKVSEKEREKMIREMLFTKSPGWKYEKEVRIIAASRLATKCVKPKPLGSKEVYLFEFPPECIQEVILGIRISGKDRTKILKAAKCLPNAKVFQAVPHDFQFKVQIVQYDKMDFNQVVPYDRL